MRIVKDDGEELNVGIQILNGYYIENKIILYYANVHTRQTEYETHNQIKNTWTINILDFNYFDIDKYHNKFVMTENRTSIYNDSCQIHIIELPKFKIKDKNNITKKEAWIAFLKGDDSFLENKDENFEQIRSFNYILDEYWKSETL